MDEIVRSPRAVEAVITPPGDKSISHRAALLNSIADGNAHVSNFCVGDDRASMLRCLRGLGARIRRHAGCDISGSDECFEIKGVGLDGLTEPGTTLNAGNSGTTMRLVTGLLAAQPFFSVITGDRSLRNRPMKRIATPLTSMGARISGRKGGSLAPLAVEGGNLRGIDYEMPVASAQLKSSILIAGLYAKGQTTVRQPALSRDHTERMMGAMGADVVSEGLSVTVKPSRLKSINVNVPCDISAASFWMVAGCCHPNARVRVKGVGINPSRAGVLEVLKSMGAGIRLENVVEVGGEPSADIVAESSDLVGIELSGDIIPRIIDELPVLALAACFARGTTVIRDANELRLKESDRISATVVGLRRLGADIEETDDGMIIKGGSRLSGAECDGFGDHRIAMTMGIAGLLANGETTVGGTEAAAVSYPDFWDTLRSIQDS